VVLAQTPEVLQMRQV